ncbi:uncharacterized protein LOC132696492 [Cylas formicarius]|uniref:uncharacterized protein LOC132696492 n=1 Tax=Cylas formicarius TaxID=197179 RepID=UPI0029587340|nr:uncharacterized protein LOC132696492 [Cylas formicarius]
MPIVNNEPNINRMNLKMSEDFYHATDVKLSESINYFEPTIQPLDYSNDDRKFCIPMYATCSESIEVTSSDLKTQTSECEIQALKEWLLLHSDLIQQQNDDILDKERQIFFLKRQNEILREQLKCVEKGIPYDPEKFFTGKCKDTEGIFEEDMTEDSSNPYVDNKEQVLQQRDDVVSCSLEVINYGSNHISDTESQVDTTIDEESFNVVDCLKQGDYMVNEFNDNFKEESDNIECNISSECSFNLDTLCEFDPFKNVRMSIRRKRVTSNSSVLSNIEATAMKGKENLKRKKRCLSKGCRILTTKEPYATNACNEHNLMDSEFNEVSSITTLEVPRWRVKLYTSCYTMEGTENLDDEVYNKRHLRLEIDERRRKRWDVQRIREQRVIEKLKQRHEKGLSGSKSDDNHEGLFSLWPRMEDIKYIEITEELPVTAFGYPIPKIFPRKM